MTSELIQQLFLICPLVFCAGVVDSIAGGGGLISLPAYTLAGIPPHVAYGTNKFANCIGTFASTYKFIRNGKYLLKPAGIACVFAIIGSNIGAKFILRSNENILNILLLVMLPLLILITLKSKSFISNSFSSEVTINKKFIFNTILIGFFVGLYDGIFGPGTGTFLTVGFIMFCRLPVLVASGNAKIVNLFSNISALIVFLFNGKILFTIGLPAALCSILGNYVGATLTIKKGGLLIKKVIVFSLVVLFLTVLINIV